jgi:diguanylate cyclase (GGDEF)-like protein/PAS domain S-box-containing protein
MERYRKLTLADICTRDPVCIDAEAMLGAAIELLQARHVSAVIVVSGSHPVGIFTERDALAAVAAGHGHAAMPVRARMTPEPLTCARHVGFLDGYVRMLRRGVRHLVLLDDEARIAGIVSQTDFVRALDLTDAARGRSVADIMVRRPAALAPSAPVQAALELMLDQAVSSVLVVAEERPVGVLTERDVHRLNALVEDLHRLPLADVMTTPVTTCTGAERLDAVVARMQAAGVRRLPVVDLQGRLIGIVTNHDLLKDLRARHEELLHELVDRQARELTRLRERMDADFALDALLARPLAPGLIAADAAGKVRYASPAAQRLLGLESVDEASLAEVVQALGGDAEAYRRQIGRLGVDQNQELELELAALERAVACDTVAIGDAAGGIAGFLMLVTDVTRRRHGEQRFARLFEMAPLAMMLARLDDGLLLDVNPAAEVLTGHARGALLGHTSAELGLWDEPAARDGYFRDLADGLSVRARRAALKRADGSRLGVELYGEPLVLDGERCLLSMLVDVTPQTEYLRQIEHHHHLLGAVFAAIGDALLLTDPGQRIVLANPAVQAIFGASPERVTGRPLRDFFADAVSLAALAAGADRSAVARTGVLPARTADGKSFPAEVSFSALGAVAAERRGCVVLVRDISGRERRAIELATHQARLQDLIDTIGDWVWEIDTEARYTYASERVQELLGYAPEALLGRTPFELMPPEEAERVAARFAAIAAAGTPFTDVENVCLTAVGERRFISTSGTPIRGADGRIVGWRGTDRDITESKRAAERLRDSEAQLRAIFDHANVGIMLLTGKRIITRANARLAEILGYADPCELEGKSVRTLHLSDARFDAFGAGHYAELRERDQLHLEYQLARRDGSAVWCLISGAALDTARPADLTRGVIWTVEDISAIKANEAELLALNARLQEEHELFTSGPAMVFRWLPQPGWPVAQCSPNAHLHLDVAPDALAQGGFAFADLLHPDDMPRVGAEIAAYTEAGVDDFEQEYRVRGPDGDWRHVYDYTRIRRDAAGALLAYHGYLVDITERRRALAALREGELRYRTMFESAGQPMLTLDADGRFTAANRATCELMGCTDASKLLGVPPAELSPPTQPDGVPSADKGTAMVRQALATGRCRFEWEHRRRDGSPLHVDVTLTRVELHGQRALLATWYDLTDRRRAEELEQRARAVFENTTEGIMLTDADNRIVAVNPAFTAITGYSAEEAIGQPASLLQSGRQEREFYRAMWRQISAAGSWRGELWNRRKDGEVYAEWLSISEIRNADGTVRNRIGVFSDITRMRRSEEEIEHLTHYDPITGLPNQRLLRARLEQALQSARVADRPLVLMLLNLDGFKRVVASFGHDAADAVLASAARRLAAQLPADATLARTVGDTFAVVLELPHRGASPSRNAVLLQDALREEFSVPDGATVALSCCIGLALYPRDDITAAALLRDADAALQRAKTAGPGNIAFYQPGLTEAAQRQLALARTLRTALATNQFELHFQPQLYLAQRTIVAAEALLRWRRPDGVLVTPEHFMEAIEKSDMALDLDRWVLREAARTVVGWQRSGLPRVRVSVNMSAAMLTGGNLAADVEAVLAETGLDPTLLEVEVLENILIEDPDRAEAELIALGGLGVGIALDDFGTGYASLGYLKRFAFDYLKIDRSFISGLMPGSDDLAIVRATILMAHHLGIRVVAEGVEHDHQIRQLAVLGCDLLQGYRIGRPMPADAFVALLRDGDRALPDDLAPALTRRALLVGDDTAQLRQVTTQLGRLGWAVLHEVDADRVLGLVAREPPELVLCDLGLPGGDALDLLALLRERHPAVPRVLLADSIDVVQLLDAMNRGGVYRCLKQPCPEAELAEAVEAAYAHGLRRLRAEPPGGAPPR